MIEGYDITSATYLGWCVDVDHTIDCSGTVPYDVTLYCSYDPEMPNRLQNENLDEVNYILNHKQGDNRDDVQQAIWYILTLNAEFWPSGPLGQAMYKMLRTMVRALFLGWVR